MVHLADFPANHTAVCIPFDSFAASTGAPSATSNFAAGDVQIYKDGGTTQRSSSAGITVSTSFDSQTGLQMIVIDLSDNTDAGFYAAGHEYQVAVADVTIDGQTVRFWAATFSIERANGVLARLKAGTVKVDVDTIKTNPVVNGGTITFPTTATLASTTNITAATGVDVTKFGGSNITATAGVPEVKVQSIANGVIAAATFAANALDAVWSTATRLLTAGTNIVLAKGVGVTGFNDIAASAIIDDATPFHGASIAAIKAKTDNLPASPAAVSDIPTATQNADALLKRDMSAVTGEAARSPLNAFRWLRNRWVIAGGTLSVKKEDDTTNAWTAVVTQTAGNPVSESDPA